MRISPAISRSARALAVALVAVSCIADDPDAALPPLSATSDPSPSNTTTPPRGSTAIPSAPFGASRLLSGADCDIVLERIVTVALERVTAWGLDQPYDWRVMPVEVMATDDIAMAESAATDAGSAPAFSDTNTQEAGVDEADTVETDGRVLYTVDENGVTIIDIATATVLATINPEPADHRLLLVDNTLTVISSPWSRWNTTVVTRVDITDP